MKAFIVDRYGSKDGAPGEMPTQFRKDETRQRVVSFPQIFNPQLNPQFDLSCMTCAAFGSPRVSFKLLQNLFPQRCHGRGREFESRRPRHSFQKS
jgi:hypothetical protein